MAKLVCTDQEELYKNILKPRIKVGNDFVSQVSKKDQVSTLTQTTAFCQMYKIASSGFKLKA